MAKFRLLGKPQNLCLQAEIATVVCLSSLFETDYGKLTAGVNITITPDKGVYLSWGDLKGMIGKETFTEI